MKFETPEELQAAIDKYFSDCEASKEHMTVTGLALSLDMTRKGLIDYENKDDPEFGNTIKRAKAKVENYIEKRLFEANATGSIFNLKNNFGWKDKTEQENTGTLTINVNRQSSE